MILLIIVPAVITIVGIIILWFRTWKHVERIKREIEKDMERE